jgi:hypothetical protein
MYPRSQEHPDRLSTLIDFIHNPINMGLLAVEQVPQFPSQLSSFRSYRTTIWIDRKRVYRLLQPLVPLKGHLGFSSILFHIKGFKIAGRAISKTQSDMPCLRRMSSNTSLAGRVRPWATSSSPWRIPSSESARAAMSSRRW